MKMKCKPYQWLCISFFYILCNVMSVKEKEAAAIADIYFSCAINERIAMRSRARSAIARIRECENEESGKKSCVCTKLF